MRRGERSGPGPGLQRAHAHAAAPSADGHIKFWKKMPGGVEFVKHYKAHMGPMTCMASSPDGTLLCTGSEDKVRRPFHPRRRSRAPRPTKPGALAPAPQSVKFYDVAAYDMVAMASVDFVPHACCWVRDPEKSKQLAAVSDRASGVIRVFDPERGEEGVREFRGHRCGDPLERRGRGSRPSRPRLRGAARRGPAPSRGERGHWTCL